MMVLEKEINKKALLEYVSAYLYDYLPQNIHICCKYGNTSTIKIPVYKLTEISKSEESVFIVFDNWKKIDKNYMFDIESYNVYSIKNTIFKKHISSSYETVIINTDTLQLIGTKVIIGRNIETDKLIQKAVNNQINSVEKNYENLEDLYDMNQPYSKLSKREYVSLYLKIPDSGTKWIDNYILRFNKK